MGRLRANYRGPTLGAEAAFVVRARQEVRREQLCPQLEATRKKEKKMAESRN